MADSAPLPVASPRRKTNESLTREDWVSAAWDMLGESGLDGVRVEPLARRLGVTKGSFERTARLYLLKLTCGRPMMFIRSVL